MIFSGLFLLGEIPFTDVIITSTVRAVDGRRMSKSLGTGIDPLEAVRKHGADATRYGLLKLSSAQDPRFSWGNIEQGAKLANKLWNVGRLILSAGAGVTPRVEPRTVEERWILRRIEETRTDIEAALPAPRFDFSHVVDTLYHLVFDDFCDWYAEAVKPRLYAQDEAAIATALAALERLLALLHPVMPHVTEEIWSHFHDSRLIVSPWPEADETPGDARALDAVQRAAATFRRSGVLVELGGDEKRIFDAVVKPERAKANGEELGGSDMSLCPAGFQPGPATPNGDVEAERERLRQEIARAEGMLANERFVSNAPAAVVDAERAKLERFRRELDAISG
jgi:valyl-tRNA synthetase